MGHEQMMAAGRAGMLAVLVMMFTSPCPAPIYRVGNGNAPTPTPAPVEVQYRFKIEDAAGRPAAGFPVSVVKYDYRTKDAWPPATVHQTVLPPDGMLEFIRFQAQQWESILPDGSRVQYHSPERENLSLRVTDPTNGQVQRIVPWQRVDQGVSATTGTIRLAFLAEPAVLPTFRGKLVDEFGNPKTDVVLELRTVQLPSNIGGAGIPGIDADIEPGPGGDFRFFATAPNLVPQLNETPTAPPKGSVAVMQMHRQNALIMRHSGRTHFGNLRVPFDENSTLQFPHLAPLSFRMFDRAGKVTTGTQAGQDFLFMRQDDDLSFHSAAQVVATIASVDNKTGVMRTEPLPLPGRFTPNVEPSSKSPYNTVTVTTATASKVIDFKMTPPVRRTAKGRVLDAVTGLPLAGVYVGIGHSAWSLAQLSDEERDIVWSRSVKVYDPQGTEKQRLLWQITQSMVSGTRTDANGRYTITTPREEPIGGMTFVASYAIPVSVNMLNVPDNLLSEEVVPMPDVYLIPFAELQVTTTAPQRIPTPDMKSAVAPDQISLRTELQFELPENWKAPSVLPTTGMLAMKQLNPRAHNLESSTTAVRLTSTTISLYESDWRGRIEWSLHIADSWNRVGSPWRVLVPASIPNMKLVVDSPYAETVEGAEWEFPDALAPYESYKLSPTPLTIRRPYYIQVNDADGKPAAGLFVNLPGRPMITTSAEGRVLGWHHGRVRYIDVLNGKHQPLARQWDVVIPASEQIPMVTITLQPDRKPVSNRRPRAAAPAPPPAASSAQTGS